jgi:hypothetical protein
VRASGKILKVQNFSPVAPGTIWALAGFTSEGNGSRGEVCVGLMAWFSANNNNSNARNDGSARPDLVPASWRDEKVADPFDDPKVRQRIAEMIIRSVVKPDKFGA